MTKEDLKQRIKLCKQAETALNKEIGKLDKIIKTAEIKKAKLAKHVSMNMLYRNSLIENL